MYPSENEPCENLAEFLTAIAGLRVRWRKLKLPTQSDKTRPYGEERALWFRGQRDAGWGLSPKIWRAEYCDANEAEMRLEFESVGHPFARSGLTVDKWHWYFLMQHYRAPTRLLDWTVNPLVALYFALCEDRECNAAVWVVDPWRWNSAHVKDLFGPAVAGWRETTDYLLDLEDAFDTDINQKQTKEKWPVAIEPSHIDQRIAAQGSKFVLFGRERDMVKSPTINRPRGGGGKYAILDRILISNEVVARLRAELNQIGINERAMFPDLEGLGRHIAWEWKTRTAIPGETKAARRVRFLRNPKVPTKGTKER